MSHLIGLADYQELCNTIMRGSHSDGSRTVNEIQPHDVSRVNAQFGNQTTCQTTTSSGTAVKVCDPDGTAPGPDYYWDTQACVWAAPTPTPTPPPPSCPDYCPNPHQYAPATCFGPVDWCQYPDTGCESGLQENGRCCCSWNTPIMLDLLGDGFSLTNSANGVVFDITGVGAPEQISGLRLTRTMRSSRSIEMETV